MLMLDSEHAEQTFIKAIDHSLIQDWEHFEFLLSFIIENRLLRIYLAYEQNRYGTMKTIDIDEQAEDERREKKKSQNRKKK